MGTKLCTYRCLWSIDATGIDSGRLHRVLVEQEIGTSRLLPNSHLVLVLVLFGFPVQCADHTELGTLSAVYGPDHCGRLRVDWSSEGFNFSLCL